MIKSILKTLKINHYIKNAVVFIPLIFSIKFTNINCIFNSLQIFIAFCLISSAVYIQNDIIDIEEDKKHPFKRNRPIPSGIISIPFAILLMIFLFITSLIISFSINSSCLLIIFLYFTLNIFYSLHLKHIPLIDAACIALGFIFRILAGCFAISVLPSPLVILMTFFISNFFTYSKRYLELQVMDFNTKCRKSLAGFNSTTISQFMLINAVLSISFYITYVLDSTTMKRADTNYLYLTVIPFTLIIYRLFFLTNLRQSKDDPIIYIEQDEPLKWLFFIYIIVLIIVLTILK